MAGALCVEKINKDCHTLEENMAFFVIFFIFVIQIHSIIIILQLKVCTDYLILGLAKSANFNFYNQKSSISFLFHMISSQNSCRGHNSLNSKDIKKFPATLSL